MLAQSWGWQSSRRPLPKRSWGSRCWGDKDLPPIRTKSRKKSAKKRQTVRRISKPLSGFCAGQQHRIEGGLFSIDRRRVFYTSRLTDSVVLAPGQPAIDLLKNTVLGGDGGGGPDKVEFEGGLNWRGMGLRLSGTWNSSYRVPGALAVQDLKYGDVTTVGARAFFDFNSNPDLLRKHPLLRSTRIVLRITNLFDAAPEVRDGTGAVPYAYQRDLLAPKDVSWEIGLRKLFHSALQRPVGNAAPSKVLPRWGLGLKRKDWIAPESRKDKTARQGHHRAPGRADGGRGQPSSFPVGEGFKPRNAGGSGFLAGRRA